MTALEVLQSAQFITVRDRRYVVLPADDWEAFVDWLEDVEDSKVVREAIDMLKRAGNDREKAGWLKWQDVANDL